MPRNEIKMKVKYIIFITKAPVVQKTPTTETLHTNRIHIGRQNALVGIFTDILNTVTCDICLKSPPKVFVTGAFNVKI